MIDRRQLARALDRREIADWVIVERQQDLAAIDELAKTRRSEQRRRWLLTVHVDVADGRGSAHLAIDAVDGTPSEIAEQAIAIAKAALGPQWSNAAPAAPAKVKLLDPTIAAEDPGATAERVLRELARPKDATAALRLVVLRERVAVLAKSGLRTDWQASELRAEALVTRGDRSLEVVREARAVADLELATALADAAVDVGRFADAKAPAAGRYAIELVDDALLHGGLGVWRAFTSQADGVVERQGLTRFRPGAAIAPGAAQVPDPLTIDSNGARDLALASAPVGDQGEAVRKFPVVKRGVAAGLGLSPREAALRRRDPNGGVRNLEVAAGSGDPPKLAEPVLELRRLRSLVIDPYTGDASLDIALGIDRATAKPFTGGTIRLDLIAALARAHRGKGQRLAGSYFGPRSVLIEHADLIV